MQNFCLGMKIKIFTLGISSDGFFVIFAISIAYSPKGFLEIFTIANCFQREFFCYIANYYYYYSFLTAKQAHLSSPFCLKKESLLFSEYIYIYNKHTGYPDILPRQKVLLLIKP